MKPMRTALATFLAATLAAGAVIATRSSQRQGLSPLPTNPGATPIELVFAQPFALDVPYTHSWRAEAPDASSGWILVLRTDPALLERRQTAEPVLYAGSETGERVNNGDGGNLVVLVPSALGANGLPVLDPTKVPIWFGTPELPERVDAQRIASELALATKQGVGPATSTAIRAQASLGTIFAPDRGDLDSYLADLIELYSPTETDLVAGLRVSITR